MKPLRKYLFICFVLTAIVSCTESKTSDGDSINNTVNEVIATNDAEDLDQKQTFPAWVDTIISNSQARIREYQCSYESIGSLQAIDTAFLKEHLMGFKIDYPRNWEFEFNPYARYYFFDCQKLDSWVSFTIMNNTEYGYDNYYTYTFDLELNKITTVSCIAQRGADGGALDKEHLSFSKSGNELTVFTQSYYDRDIFEEDGFTNCYSRSFDSIISTFYFYPNKTEYSMDTLFSALDTICQ